MMKTISKMSIISLSEENVTADPEKKKWET